MDVFKINATIQIVHYQWAVCVCALPPVMATCLEFGFWGVEAIACTGPAVW